MGMLDEAIREHLELRRLRGVDPGELAREEEAAFGTPGEELVDRSYGDAWPETEATAAAMEESAGIAVAVGAREEALYAGQETAEIDMRTVLDLDAHDTGEGRQGPGGMDRDIAAPVSAGAASRSPSLESELDQLDWEVSRDRPLAGRVRRDDELDR